MSLTYVMSVLEPSQYPDFICHVCLGVCHCCMSCTYVMRNICHWICHWRINVLYMSLNMSWNHYVMSVCHICKAYVIQVCNEVTSCDTSSVYVIETYPDDVVYDVFNDIYLWLILMTYWKRHVRMSWVLLNCHKRM